MNLRPFALLFLFALLPATARAQEAERAALVTWLGDDTLAVERWTFDGTRLEALAAIRTPRTTLRAYTLELAADGTMRRYEERVVSPADPDGAPLRTEVVARTDDGGWTRMVTEGGAPRTEAVEAGAALLPFVDLAFWPYELVLRRGAGDAPREQPLLSGSRALAFTVRRTGEDRVVVAHPFRGPSVARVDADGRLLALDASETTRKVMVERLPWLDVADHARRWAAADAAGHGVGELSGRAETQATVAGAALTVDYGTPQKRGRDVFGNVVPWNALWRTGANRATHFSTDRTLVLGEAATGTLEVPAGTYTLFSIPAPDGGTLVVSRQTGQNGNAYDPSHDLGRVPMQRVELAETVERFTIAVAPTGGQAGELRLEWDRTAFVVPFVVE